MTKAAVVLLLVMLVSLQYKLWFKEDGLRGVRQMRSIVTLQQQELIALTERNEKLSANVQLIKSDPSIIEEYVRVNFSMVRPGETYYRIIE